MNYHFSQDFAEISALLGDAVEIYLLSQSREPDQHPPVIRVELAFLCGDGREPASLYVDFDTRLDPEPDGDADFRCIAQLHRPRWAAFMLPEGDDRALSATFPDGSVHESTTDDVDQLVAKFLASTLRSAHQNGVFDRVAAMPSRLQLTLSYVGNPIWQHPPG